MAHYLVIGKSGNCWLSEVEPAHMESVETLLPFSHYSDALMAKDMYYAYKSVGEKQVIEFKNAKIDSLLARVDQLVMEGDVLQNTVNRQAMAISSLKLSLQGARSVLEHAFTAIARDLVIENTHRGRNELYRAIARIFDRWLSEPHGTSDMDDIPF